MTIFGIAFAASATLVFGIAALAGLGAARLPMSWRLDAAMIVLAALALLDVAAIRRKSFCPISWNRQTPKALLHRHSAAVTFALWGFDTGLAVTTFRVAATTWAALTLPLLGFAPWWTGLAYALGFLAPLLVAVIVRRDITLVPLMVERRGIVQAASAVMLAGAALLAPWAS